MDPASVIEDGLEISASTARGGSSKCTCFSATTSDYFIVTLFSALQDIQFDSFLSHLKVNKWDHEVA